MSARTRTDTLLLAGFCTFLFFYGLGAFGLIGADEPRYAQVAREMLERRDWITPVLGGHPWLEKPPLYYWQAMLAYSIFGVSDTAARIPSAVDGTLLVVAVYFFFRRFRRGIAIDAALITASCAGIIGYARAASMDMPLTATFAVGHARVVDLASDRKPALPGRFLRLYGVGNARKGAGSAFPGRSYHHGLRLSSAPVAAAVSNTLAPGNRSVLWGSAAVVLRGTDAQSRVLS